MSKKESGPHIPSEYKKRDLYALQALEKGEATPEQQTRALMWIIECAGTYDLSYRPDSPDQTIFAEGKRHVGLQIIKLLKLNPGKLKENTNG